MIPQRLLAVLALAATATTVAATGTAMAATSADAVARAVSRPAQHATPLSSRPVQRTDFGMRLVQVPVSERNDPRARVNIIETLRPGRVIHRLVQVGNLGTTPVLLRIYAAAAMIRHGQFLPVKAQYGRNLLTTWIRVRQHLLLLKPGQRRYVLVTIAVPRRAPKGEQYAIIWAQGSSVLRGRMNQRRQRANITLVNRVGIQVYLTVGRGGGPPSSFTLGAMSGTVTRRGKKLASVQVHNTGGLAVALTGQLTLTSQSDGLRAGPYTAIPTVIAPGQSYPVRVPLPAKLPGGPWRAVIDEDSGVLTHSERASIAFTAAAGRSGFPAAATVAVILILLALAGAVLVLRSKSGRAEPLGQHAVGADQT